MTGCLMASSGIVKPAVNESLNTLRNWERSGGTLRIVHLSDTGGLVDLCACTGERMDSLASSDREVVAYLDAYAKAERKPGQDGLT